MSEADDTARRERIRAEVRYRYTGNRHKDLAGFRLGTELEIAAEEWRVEALRRYCARDL